MNIVDPKYYCRLSDYRKGCHCKKCIKSRLCNNSRRNVHIALIMIKSMCNDCRKLIWVSKKQESVHLCTACSYQRILDNRVTD